MKTLTLIAALSAFGTTSHAQEVSPLLKGDVEGFETCFLQLMLDNRDNPTLGMIGPIICGERHIPMGQTCEITGYMLFDTRASCNAADLAFWQDQVNLRTLAALMAGQVGAGLAHGDGLARCEELVLGGEDRLDCLIELNWRTTMEFIAHDVFLELFEDSE